MLEEPEVEEPETYEFNEVEPSPDAGANHRVPCAVALDTSASMSGRSIRQLNEAIRDFKRDLLDDDRAAQSVELALVTFDSSVDVIQDFVAADSFQPPNLTAGGSTNMGEGVLRAADLIESRKDHYRKQGLTYNRPWIWVMTDGRPNGNRFEAAKQTIKNAEEDERFLFFAAGTGGANHSKLRELAHDPQRVIEMKGQRFAQFFKFVSDSLKRSSRSRPGEQLALPPPSQTWARVST